MRTRKPAEPVSEVATDKLGHPITEGAFIIYGHALGRSAGLRIGKVLKVSQAAKDAFGSRGGDPWRIRVQGVDDDWSSCEPQLCRPGTLQFPERTIVVEPEQVPAKIRELLGVVT